MRAIRLEQTGGPEQLRMQDLPEPSPGPNQVRIRVAYAALNPMDVHVRSGAMKWGVPPLPLTLGYEFSGRIDAAGDGADPALVGRRVVTTGVWGGYGDLALAPVSALQFLPDDIGWELGTVYRSTAATAWHVLHTVGRVREGDVVVVHAAAGPVGILATQIARDAGATVAGLVSSPDKIAFAEPYGAALLHDYRAEPDWAAAVKAWNGGRGVDLIIDGVQGPGAPQNYLALAPLGQVIYLGAAGGAAPEVPIPRLIAGSIGVRGLVVYHAMARTKGTEFPVIDQKIASGAWRYPLKPALDLADVQDAHRAFEARKLTGRTIFRVGGEL